MKQFIVPALQYQEWRPATKTLPRRRVLVKNLISGYMMYQVNSRGKIRWTRKVKRYMAWRDHVREHANLAGIPTPCLWTPENPCLLICAVWFADPSKKCFDVENVRKGVLDALVWVAPEVRKVTGMAKGDDAWCFGYHTMPMFDRFRPRVEVTLFDVDEWIEAMKLMATYSQQAWVDTNFLRSERRLNAKENTA